ncbi:MAG: hypothetical protein ABIJ47_10490 [Candidatus Bathyarchaeota archaeon]
MSSESKDIVRYLKKISEDIDYIKKMYVIQNRFVIHDSLESVLNDDRKKLTYDLFDGNTSTNDIIELLRLNRSTLYAWINQWMKMGIINSDLKKGSKFYKKIFSLEDLNISKPSIDEFIDRSNYMFNLPNDYELHKLLSNINVKYPKELETLTHDVFNSFFVHVSDIVIEYNKSTNKKKLLYIQGLRQIGEVKKDTEFIRYFNQWENNIKHKDDKICTD